jgi:nucleoside-diphosphate-sugar epimerase
LASVVVTGAAGFIGSRICHEMLRGGHEVIGIDSITDYYDSSLKKANLQSLADNPGFTHIDIDLVNDPVMLPEDCELIFHEAGQPGVRRSWGSEFASYVDANILATQRLLEEAKGLRELRRFVYASSSSIYGNAVRYPVTETDLPQPVSPYGVSKLAAEHLVSLYGTNFGVPTVSLRYFTVYGPGQRPDMAFTRFMTAALSGRSLEVYGSGDQIRDFTYVDDVVSANLAVVNSSIAPASVFNVAGGTSITVNAVLDLLSNIHGEALDIVRKEAVAGDVFRTGGAADALSAKTGWQPSTSIREGLTSQYRWAASHLSSLERAVYPESRS